MNETQFNTSLTKYTPAATLTRSFVLTAVESCVFVFLDLSAFLGNLLVCLAVYRNPSLRTITSFFIVSLAVSDLLMSVVVMPLSVVSSISGRWAFGDVGFNIAGYVGYGLALISILTLALTSLNRYFCVSKHSFYVKIYTRRRVKLMIIFLWIIAPCILGIAAITAKVKFTELRESPTFGIPESSSEAFTPLGSTYVIIFIFLPFLVITVCCWKIYRAIHNHNTAAVAPALQGSTSYGVEEKKITRTLVTVLLAFCACFIPATIVILLVLFGAFNKKAAVFLSFYYPIPVYISSAINPLIYSTMNKTYRKEFRKLLFLK